uniref:CSON008437 protein n=1 Tax=Culicoides sonorensis TaxID=179676 RepID=A0A336LJP8_CULSO
MIFIDNNSATEGKKLLESHLLNARNGKKVSVGLIVKLALKVVQQKIRHTTIYFSVIAAKCMCGILSWIIVFFGSMFFATKIIYSTKHSCKQTPVPVPECLLDTIPEQKHKCRHQTAMVRPVPKPTPISSDSFYDCVEEKLTKSLETDINTKDTDRIPEIPETEEILSKTEKISTDNLIKSPKIFTSKPRVPLERRLSNVERFLKESSPEPEPLPKENTRLMLGIVYSSCVLVAVQLLILISTLLSTTIPLGLMFLVVCLCIIVGLIWQITFSVRNKTKNLQENSKVSRKRRRTQSNEEENTVTATNNNKNKITLKCDTFRGKPVAPVKPFMLVRIPSTKELFSGIGLKSTMSLATDLLKKKN